MKTREVAKTLGENLYRVRTAKGISRKELSKIVGVGVGIIGDYENGKVLAPLDKIFKIADFLQVSVASLTGENNFDSTYPEIPNVEKIVDDKIFEYRYKRALELTTDAKGTVREYRGELIISIPNTFKHVEPDGKISAVTGDSAYKIKDKESFINIVEVVESNSIRQNLLFPQAFQNFMQSTLQK